MQIKITFNHFSTVWLAKSQEFHNTLYGKSMEEKQFRMLLVGEKNNTGYM